MIARPSNHEVSLYLKKWDDDKKLIEKDSCLYKLFLTTYPNNKDLDDILAKSSTLNSLYSTNIFSIYDVAKHIHSLKIDDRLKKNDLTLVKDIAQNTINKKNKNFYSFATKYCSHHKPDNFPIYDKYVEKVLMYFKKDKFAKFKKADLKDYEKFYTILLEFKKFYNITYGLKDLDKYLWLLGKENF